MDLVSIVDGDEVLRDDMMLANSANDGASKGHSVSGKRKQDAK